MKKVERLIKAYEAEGGRSGVRLYSFVRPLKNGEAVFEIHAAANSRNKGNPLMTKCIYRMRTDDERYQIRDCIEYHSWSSLCHDHLIVDFHEHGGPTRTNYERVVRDYTRGKWERNEVDRSPNTGFAEQMLPMGIMLNGFDGTKYQYCAYTPMCGLPFADYIHLYSLTPKVELLSKARLYHLLTEDICLFLADNPRFGKFLAKHIEEARHWTPFRVKREYARQDPEAKAAVRRAKLEADQRRDERRREAEIRAERRRIAQRTREAKKYNKAIRNLYERVKDICATYGAYEVYVPQNAAEMAVEGEAMHNCIGKCFPSQVADGKCLCVFLRKDGKPCVDIEIDLKTFEVKQCRAKCNADAPKVAWEVARQLAASVRALLAA